jgi:hypothetical protein
VSDQISPFSEWYSARDELVPFIGERAFSLFAFTVFDESGGRVGASYFRDLLTASGNNVDDPQVTETERLLIDWGRLVARDSRALEPKWRNQFESTFKPALQELLVRFAALTIATSVTQNLGPAENSATRPGAAATLR